MYIHIGFGSVWAFRTEARMLRRFQNEATSVLYAVINKKTLVSAIHIAHCIHEMIVIISDACYQILSCVCILMYD